MYLSDRFKAELTSEIAAMDEESHTNNTEEKTNGKDVDIPLLQMGGKSKSKDHHLQNTNEKEIPLIANKSKLINVQSERQNTSDRAFKVVDVLSSQEDPILSGLSMLSDASDCRLIEPDKISKIVVDAIRKLDVPKLKEYLSVSMNCVHVCVRGTRLN